jgi:hypothetical protein
MTDNFNAKDIRTFKKRIIQSILNTDMALMKDLRIQLQEHLDKFEIKNGENVDRLIDKSSP